MTKLSKPLIAIVIIAVCVGAIVGFKIIKGTGTLKAAKMPARARGNPQAKLQIKEFIDLQCPACAEGSKYLKAILTKDPKAFYLELRYYPLPMHKHGLTSARYAECAARQEKFWPFVDYLLEHQKDWSQLADARPAFALVAKEAGLDNTQLESCLADEKITETVESTRREGRALDISSTPTYFINGKMVVGVKSLKEELDPIFYSTTPATEATTP